MFNANYTRTNSEVKYPRTVIETKVIFDPSFQVVTLNLDSLYVDRLLDQPRDIVNLSLGYDYKGFSGRLSMNYISNVFSTTNFWPGLREDTDAYRRYDLSMKQKLPIKGLELYLNISNLTEAVDITRLRGDLIHMIQILMILSMMKFSILHCFLTLTHILEAILKLMKE